MFQRDYLMKQLLVFFQALARSLQQRQKEDNPLLAAQTLENAISSATDLDGAALLSLSPESIAQVLRVSGVDPQVVSYIAHGLLLESQYLTDACEHDLADVRKRQALALAQSYGFELPDDPADLSQLEVTDEPDDLDTFESLPIGSLDDLEDLLGSR